MATIHVIYDPQNKLSVPSAEFVKATGISMAILSLPDVIDNNNIDDLCDRLTEMLLEQIKS